MIENEAEFNPPYCYICLQSLIMFKGKVTSSRKCVEKLGPKRKEGTVCIESQHVE